MKINKLVFIFITTLVGSSCTNGQEKKEALNTDQSVGIVEQVDAEQFKQMAEKGEGIILDVRTPEEINQGYIPGASTINIYDQDFESKLNLIQKDKPVYVYCKAGGRSNQAAELMKKNGFKKVYNLDGGITSWMNKGFAVTKPEKVEDENIRQMTMDEFNTLLKINQPVLVDFHTLWCAPCRKMAPVVDKISDDYKGKATVLRIDLDRSKEIAAHFQIQGVPVFILFKNGEQKWKHNGVISEDELRKIIETYL